jgi:hypothetical protein
MNLVKADGGHNSSESPLQARQRPVLDGVEDAEITNLDNVRSPLHGHILSDNDEMVSIRCQQLDRFDASGY